MIDVYYWPTPNGWKISIMLEECGLPYRIVPVAITRGEQFWPWLGMAAILMMVDMRVAGNACRVESNSK